MHEQHPAGETSEELSADLPKIYVASLADYNAGRLHGAWLDAAQDIERLHAGIAIMLAASPEPGAEEYAIHDYDGFGSLRLGEYESLETITAIAGGIAAHGPAFAAWADAIGPSEAAERPADFDDVYLGNWNSRRDFAEQLADDLGWEQELQRLPDGLRSYVHLDYDGLARDLAMDLDFADHDDGAWVFDNRS